MLKEFKRRSVLLKVSNSIRHVGLNAKLRSRVSLCECVVCTVFTVLVVQARECTVRLKRCACRLKDEITALQTLWLISLRDSVAYIPALHKHVWVCLRARLWNGLRTSKRRLTSWSRWPPSAWCPGSCDRRRSSPRELSGWWWAFLPRLHFPSDECPPWEREGRTDREMNTTLGKDRDEDESKIA